MQSLEEGTFQLHLRPVKLEHLEVIVWLTGNCAGGLLVPSPKMELGSPVAPAAAVILGSLVRGPRSADTEWTRTINYENSISLVNEESVTQNNDPSKMQRVKSSYKREHLSTANKCDNMGLRKTAWPMGLATLNETGSISLRCQNRKKFWHNQY
ncbi:uncharacterized protein LOC143684902 [Tamandua tetradactyla]|uniref:uncharacterized protein LOC143684902 n=1 Tax=Tamandua tetradactyla TaxID=48850 RepID=UPI0040539B6B